jgi:hypothetical protein
MPPEIRRAQLQKLERSGRVFFVLYAPRGEIRGAVLEDGSQFLIPVRPAESNQFGLQVGECGFERLWNLQRLRHLFRGDGTIRQWGIHDDSLWS